MIESLTFWHWISIGGALLILELLIGAEFLLWLAFPAFVTAGLSYIFPGLDWKVQALLYIVISVIAIVVWYKFYKGRKLKETDQPFLNQRQNQYIGNTYSLATPLKNGSGKLVINDSQWTAKCLDHTVKANQGDAVKVVAVDGLSEAEWPLFFRPEYLTDKNENKQYVVCLYQYF